MRDLRDTRSVAMGLIRDDAAGDLAAFNAHTESFGTYVENDTDDGVGSDADDEVAYDIFEKIMTLFE
jgi:hypothetical protein